MKPAVYCDQMRLFLAQAGDDSDHHELEQSIIEHLASCTVCRAENSELSRLLQQYCSAEPRPLSGELEARLLDNICARLHR